MKRILILGYGYTAKYLVNRIQANAQVFTTSRNGGEHIEFDLSDPQTWPNLPQADGTFWTFPASPSDLVQAFTLNPIYKKLGRVVVIGSTGSIVAHQVDEWVDETNPLDTNQERVLGETTIIDRGGIGVYASGIYGPGRNPLSWVERGLVGPSDKFVNFIHVEDLAQILWAAMEKGEPETHYLASDGEPYRWKDLIASWKKEHNLAVPEASKLSKRLSKRVQPTHSLDQLGIQLLYPNVIAGVRALTE